MKGHNPLNDLHTALKRTPHPLITGLSCLAFFLLSDYASSSVPNRRAVIDQLCPHQRQGAAV